MSSSPAIKSLFSVKQEAGPWPTPDVVLVAAPADLVKKVHADVHVNARNLDNPYHTKTLHDLWGLHPKVVQYVRLDPKLEGLIGAIPAEVEELWTAGKTALPIVVLTTCRGAYHRSPAVNYILAERLVKKGFHVEQRVYKGKDHPTATMPDPRDAATSVQQLVDEAALHVVQGLSLPSQVTVASELRWDVYTLLMNGKQEAVHG